MAVLAMKRLNICGMKREQAQIIETLQASSVIEFDDSIFLENQVDTYQVNDEKVKFDRKAIQIENALEAINMYVPEKKGMLSALEGKNKINKSKLKDIVYKESELESLSKKALDNMKKIIENRVDMDRNKVTIQSLEPWLDMDIPMEFTHTDRVAFLIGTISKIGSIEEIYEGIGAHLLDLTDVEISIVHQDKFQTCLVAICLKEFEDAVENGLHTLGFARISNGFSGIPKEEASKLERENRNLQEENEALIKEFEVLADNRDELQMLSDYYRIEASKFEGLGKVGNTDKTFVLSGYVPAGVISGLVKKLEERYNLFCEVVDIDKDEEAPVLLKNSGIGETVESVVESYGLPQKKEIDPSGVMSGFYIFLFGLMLSDAAYGLIMFLACLFLLGKYKNMETSMRKSVKLFMYCGISTLVWGVLFGGYFGDAIDIISKTFFGKTVTIEPLWFAPLNDPMRLLLYCMLFGIVHLFMGLLVKGYINIRDKEYMNLFCDVILWLSLLVGLIMMLLSTELFYSLAKVKIVYPPAIAMLAKGLAIFGALGIFLMSGRESKGVGLRLALGAYDLYNLTGWLSDLLSYSRLLALGLATGVIASVINQIGSMGGNSVVGVILFIAVFIFGHIFNMAINLLGAYVHTNRLQYVEFFSKFYEGGGRAFNPFRSNTKYIDIEVGEEK